MATHSSILAWRISWTEESDRLQSMGPQRVRHDCVIFHFTGLRSPVPAPTAASQHPQAAQDPSHLLWAQSS